MYRTLTPIAIGFLFLGLLSASASADAYRSNGIHGRTAKRWVASLTSPAALAQTTPAFRYSVRVTYPCLAKHKRDGLAAGTTRAKLFACLADVFSVRRPDAVWTVVQPDRMPSADQQRWARTLPKRTTFVLGTHGDGYIVLALAPGAKPRKASAIWIDDALGGREMGSKSR